MSGGSGGSYRKGWSSHNASNDRRDRVSHLSDERHLRSLHENERRRAIEERKRLQEQERRAAQERERRIEEARRNVANKAAGPRKKREEKVVYDESMVRLAITEPKEGVDVVHVVVVDNSGSNHVIAKHFKKSSGYLIAGLRSIDPKSQIAYIYASDHCDGENIRQDVDYVSPDEEGDKILHSTISHISGADGGDAAEAFECVLHEVCDLKFGDATNKHLYLITDVVGHHMGMRSDDGCPLQRDWRDSLDRVKKHFTTFQVIGTAERRDVAKLQEKFIQNKERLRYDLLDLSEIRDWEHRAKISGNALLFLMARNKGFQTVEMFLSFLYEKWIRDPVFGEETDLMAQEAIRRFGKYIDDPDADVEALMKKVLHV